MAPPQQQTTTTRTATLSVSSRRQLLAACAAAASATNAVSGATAAEIGLATSVSRQENDVAAAAASKVVDTYRRDGVAVVRSVVSPHWIEKLRRGCEEAQDEPGEYAQYLGKATDVGTFFTDLEMARRLPTFAEFALLGPCAAVAGAVTGSDSVRYLYDQLFIKEAGVSLPTPWHQDGGYWRAKGEDLCSVFVPLDKVAARDCLAFLPGTQHWELHNPAHFADGTPYTGTSLPELTKKDLDIVPERLTFDLEPGDVLVFSAKTVHGGEGNWGRALSTRWAGDDVRFWARPGEGAVPTGNLNLRQGDPLERNPAAFPEAWRRSIQKVASA